MKYIDEIALEMVKQNNRATQYPLFVVMETVEVCVPDSQADGSHRKDDDDGIDPNYLCEDCLKLAQKEEDLPDWCNDCDSECFWSYRKDERPNLLPGVFFTAKACQEHIDSNKYHYTHPKVFGVGAWRNPEMVEVMHNLIERVRAVPPSHYE